LKTDVAAPLAPDGYGSGLGGEHRRSISERVYAGLLHLYPSAFRANYRDEMVVLFGDQLRDARTRRGTRGVVAIWIRTLGDLARSAVGEHLRRDRTMAQSLASFEPTRSMRLLGLVGVAGGVVLLWAFISLNPFGDQSVNFVRLSLFWLGGMAIALALYGRLAAASPRLAALTTAAVLVSGVWNALWAGLAISQENPYADAFGGIGIVGGIVAWIVQAAYGVALLRMASAMPGMNRHVRTVSRIAALALVLGGPLAFLGINDRELANWQGFEATTMPFILTRLGQIGLILTGAGWIMLGTLLVLAGRRVRVAA
jgi:hypothetical protein